MNGKSKAFCAVLVFVLAAALIASLAVTAFNKNELFTDEKPSISSGYIKNASAYVESKGYSPSEFTPELLKLLEKHPESEAFVLGYPDHKDKQRSPNMKEYRNCESVPLLIQWDTRWGYAPYGNGIVGLDGCGPTCLSMVSLYYLQDMKLSPDYIAKFASDNGYYKDGVGTKWDLFTEGGSELGLDINELPLDQNVMKNSLDDGNSLILSLGPGDFTEKGHFIVVTDYGDGGFTVNDPNSYENSEKMWSYERLSPQIKNLWSVNKA